MACPTSALNAPCNSYAPEPSAGVPRIWFKLTLFLVIANIMALGNYETIDSFIRTNKLHRCLGDCKLPGTD